MKNKSLKTLPVAIMLSLFYGLIFFTSCATNTGGTSTSPSTQSAPSTTTSSTPSNSPSTDSNKLTNTNVEAAVRQLLSNLSQGGSFRVEGVQELPQTNEAVADLIFEEFKYAADNYGTPVAKDRYNPKPLPKDRLPTPGELFQPKLKSYSGRGKAMLKHYNDGRWSLKEVRWGSGEGWTGNVTVR
jgi:guanyl-specific ribonuclease Sa